MSTHVESHIEKQSSAQFPLAVQVRGDLISPEAGQEQEQTNIADDVFIHSFKAWLNVYLEAQSDFPHIGSSQFSKAVFAC